MLKSLLMVFHETSSYQKHFGFQFCSASRNILVCQARRDASGEHEKAPRRGPLICERCREHCASCAGHCLISSEHQGRAPDTPEGRTYANSVCVRQDMPSMMSCRASATMAESYSYTPSRQPSINVRNFLTAGQPAAAASSSTVARALTLRTSRHSSGRSGLAARRCPPARPQVLHHPFRPG